MSNASREDIVAFGREQTNIVVLNSIFPQLREQCFSADHVQGGVVAAKALLQHHHRRLAVIAGPASSPDNVARLKGFMDELRRHRIDPQTVRTIDSDFSPEGGWVSAKALLASKHRFTALFCANDEMAVGVLSYFQQAGLAVPQEVSVLGYDDTQSAEYSAPRLTSVHVPLREVTTSGLNFLLNRCYDSLLPVEREFPINVVWRASVALPPQPHPVAATGNPAHPRNHPAGPGRLAAGVGFSILG